ncbi:enterotoxin [Dyella silvatica]|uniref:enterotoxin n=1 Tax=Dyella silvatica TaxID=2992128 RepID=UPI002251A778|nr:enterotoxin [Dyella silvatica]
MLFVAFKKPAAVVAAMASRRSLSPRRGTRLAVGLLAGLIGCGLAHADESGISKPGVPVFSDQAGAEHFGNAAIEASWKVADQHLTDMLMVDRSHDLTLKIVAPFALTLADGKTVHAADMHLAAAPSETALPVNADASRLAERLPGKAVQATFTDGEGRFRVQWQLLQRDDSPYLREQVSITALKQDENITGVSLFELQAAGVQVSGDVKGSPAVVGDAYVGFEHPLSESEARGNHVKFNLVRGLPLEKGKTITYSAVAGVTRSGQLRRDFAAYIERERAHPYRPFLHYNSWYDIGYFTPYTEEQALDRINAFGKALHEQRGVQLDSYLFDDGWDDRSGSWHFSKDFPHGFVPLRDAAAKYGAAPGVWLSPWGGYGPPKEIRVKEGRANGYEIIDGGLALSGPKYYQRFHDAVLSLVKDNGINQFKFDGTGNADKVFPGSRFTSDFDAAIQLIEDVREAKPDTFINLTTGTYPSPFWLRYADSIWRDGEDDDLAGVGSNRERWITYRDAQTYRNVVLKGPLFPINSLMLHGIIYAQQNRRLNSDPGHDFSNEVRSYFATGTQLQEMYITPSLLSTEDWDVLAEAARWSRTNANVLRDTHWIGGDPQRLNVYGWAAWSPEKAIITLRNPDAHEQVAVIDLPRQLELPAGAASKYSARSPWKSDSKRAALSLDTAHATTIPLKPFEVLTLELTPLK